MPEPLSEADLTALELWAEIADGAPLGKALVTPIQQVCREVRRLRTLEVAVRRFLALPNWRNRVGTWTDVQDALAELERAAADNCAVPGGPT